MSHDEHSSAAEAGAEGDALQKSKNQLKNEAKRLEKLAKFNAKKEKQAQEAATKEAKGPTAGSKGKKAGSGSSAEVFVDTTVPGEKKDMTIPMADAFNPRAVEAAWYSWWEKCGFFKPEYAAQAATSAGLPEPEVFSMVMPPPNVTGSLHLGHAMMASIEDTLARWHRMCGKQVLYLPGCDHAGIATQAVVEKKLQRERGLTKYDLGREAFVQEIWSWKVQYGDTIYQQLRRMGVSADWERARFTLDPSVNEAVNEAFCRLFEDGLIFRANRLVHWSGKLRTALSDLEVEMREIEPNTWLSAYGHDPKKKYEFGVMTSLAYRLEGSETEEIVIMTTRPETVFADTAVAVHPLDERYKAFHGKRVVHPVTGDLLPVITDEAAEMTLGTGALKVSPAHDATDFALGQKHGLRFVSVFDQDNVLNEAAGSFAGMRRFDARNAVIEHCQANGTFRGQSPHAMSLPFCSRSGDIVEPRMIPQWWMSCDGVARKAADAVRTGEMRILPRDQEKIWFYWLDNIRDWCLSRQLWWGHRIPAYRVLVQGQKGGDEIWVAGRSYEEALDKAAKRLPDVPREQLVLEQDPDVLDTWFSSGLWPFSTMGWPSQEAGSDLDRFFPNSLLETGGDILFFWVARMAMLSIYLTGKVPFSEVFLHAMVRDAHGRKMSKSLGNVIDPLDVIEGISLADLHSRLEAGNLDPAEVRTAKEGQRRDFPDGIAECGTDALRIALCSYVAQGRDVNLNIKVVQSFRRFGNKLWNAIRFALMKLGPDFVPAKKAMLTGNESPADAWILGRMHVAIEETNRALSEYNLMAAVQAVQSFWLYDLCDVYIEVAKLLCDGSDTVARDTARQTLYTALDTGLRLLHPFMPFVTEELYQRLPRRPEDSTPSLVVASYPEARKDLLLPEAAAAFERINAWARDIRSFASDRKLPTQTTIAVRAAEPEAQTLLDSQQAAILALTRQVGRLQLSSNSPEQQHAEALELSLADGALTAIFSPPASKN